MKKLYTQEEIEVIRLAFNSGQNIGTLQTLVNESIKKNPGLVGDMEALVKFYISEECKNIGELIPHLFTTETTEMGSASIDFLGVTDGPFTIENAMSLQELRIGSRRSGINSATWFAHLAEGFANLPKLQKEGLDLVCEAFLVSFKINF